jgi:hypothetical protein
MQSKDQSSHLAGKRHATRSQQNRAVARESRVKERSGLSPTRSSRPAESSNISAGTGQLSSLSTPTTSHKQNSRSSPSGAGSSEAITHNSGTFRSKTREHGTQTNDEPSLAQSVPATALPAFEFTDEKIAKPLDFVTAYGYSYVLVWECKPCSRWMPLSSKAAHLICATHIERLLQLYTISSSVVAQEQYSNGAEAPMFRIGAPQALNLRMNSPGSSPLVSQQGNGAGTQSGTQQASRTSKRKSAKPQRNPDTPQSSTPQPRAHKTRATSSNTGSTSESATRSWTCPQCRAVLAIHQKAAHHCMRPRPSTQAPSIGPLDRFFRSFPSFPYDAYKSPDVSFSELLSGLRTWHTWDHKSPNTWKLYLQQVKEEYQESLTHEFNLYFGTEDDIESWHALCRAVRIQPPPLTCEDCRSVSSQTPLILEDRDGISD